MKSYTPSLTGSMAFFNLDSLENWDTSSISAPARSIVAGTAWRRSTGVGTMASRISASETTTSYTVTSRAS